MNCSPVLDCSCSRASGVWGQRNTAVRRARSESIAARKCKRCNTGMPLHRCWFWRMFRKHAARGKWAQPHRLAMHCSPVLDCSCSRASGVWGQRNTAVRRARGESIAERKCSRCNTSIAMHRCCSWRMPRKKKHIPTRTERAEQRRKVICVTKDPERKQSGVLRSVPERGPRPNRSTLNFRVETHGISPFRYLAVTRV